MGTRMDRYNLSAKTASRTEKNQHLYNSIDDINVDHIDINDAKEINLSDMSSSVNSREEYRKVRDIRSVVGEEEERKHEEVLEEPEEKIYDINEILNRAKENRVIEEEKEKKRCLDTEYNILTKLDLEHIEEEKEEMKKENLHRLIDTIYSNTLPVDVKKAANAEEEDDGKPMFSDLMKTEVELDVDISKEILDQDEDDDLKENTREKIDRQELTDLINKTFIGTGELEKRKLEEMQAKLEESYEEDDDKEKDDEDTKEEKVEDKTEDLEKTQEDVDIIEESDKKFVIVIIIISVLIVLSIIGIIVLKKMGVF